MGWNEPPGGKGRDPWGGRGNGGGPPDLDEIVRKMQQGLGGIFGRKPTGVGGGGGRQLIVLLIIIVALVVLIIDMTYFIEQKERGVVLRFGAYSKTWKPGLNFRLPTPIEEVIRVNIEQVRPLTHKAIMLTQDENIVDVEVAVQWRINDPAAFLFNVNAPTATLRQVTESAVREVIGKSKLDFVLTEGRGEISQRQREIIQQTMDDYGTGITIAAVEMQPAKPPDQVKSAFDDAIKAREDEQRLINEAEAYRNDLIPRARGAAARLREEANGYKARVIATAEGETARFEQLLAEYERAPSITRQRLYLEAVEGVLANSNKVLLDAKGSNSLMYLPLDKIIERRTSHTISVPRDRNSESSGPGSVQDDRDRTGSRSRGNR